jgi:homotetrameric cytidine deaminase
MLAQSLVSVAGRFGVQATALVTSMNQPNGRLAGNGVEIDEALDVLGGKGPSDLRDLSLALAGEILLMKSLAADAVEARAILVSHLESGRALAKFAEMIAAQGGDLAAPRPRAPSWTLTARQSGYVTAIEGEQIGLGIVEMGGGRKQLDDAIDPSVGVEMLVRLGDRVEQGQPLMNIFASTVARSRGLRLLETCITIGSEPPTAEPLIAERVEPSRSSGEAATRNGELAHVDAAKRREVIDAALAARGQAHAPYSGFRVGAAVLTTSGKIYRGANIENASFGLTLCAERVALAAAIAAGETRFALMAVASLGGAAPCGACRQFAAEFARELPILLVDADVPGGIVESNLRELLPAQFSLPGKPSGN